MSRHNRNRKQPRANSRRDNASPIDSTSSIDTISFARAPLNAPLPDPAEPRIPYTSEGGTPGAGGPKRSATHPGLITDTATVAPDYRSAGHPLRDHQQGTGPAVGSGAATSVSSQPMAGTTVIPHVGLRIPPIEPLPITQQGLEKEAVSADGLSWILRVAKALPKYIDDLSGLVGDDIYDRMTYDGAVKAAINTLKSSVLEEGVTLGPAVHDILDPRYPEATKILDFCNQVLENIQPSLDTVLWDMLRAFHTGNSIAEMVYEPEDLGEGAGPQLFLKSIKVKPRQSYAFVTDPYQNTIGIQALIPGLAFSLMPGMVVADPKLIPNLLPRNKFAVLSTRSENNDPRGTSMLRSAYQAWWIKMQMWPEYLKYLTQFGSPLVHGQPSPTALPETVLNPDGTTTITSPTEVLLRALENLRNGAAIATASGSDVQVVQANGNGEAFLKAFELCDKQITVSILSQTLATGEGQFNARAAAQVHQDILLTLIRQLKRAVSRMIRNDILKPLVLYNFGLVASRHYTPSVSLGETEKTGRPQLLLALTQAGYTVDPSQFHALDEELDMPSRTALPTGADIGQSIGTEGASAIKPRGLRGTAPGSGLGGGIVVRPQSSAVQTVGSGSRSGNVPGEPGGRSAAQQEASRNNLRRSARLAQDTQEQSRILIDGRVHEEDIEHFQDIYNDYEDRALQELWDAERLVS